MASHRGGDWQRRGPFWLLLLAGVLGCAGCRSQPHKAGPRAVTTWPWPGAESLPTPAGVRAWRLAVPGQPGPAEEDGPAPDAGDGPEAGLLQLLMEFDFSARPTLRLVLSDPVTTGEDPPLAVRLPGVAGVARALTDARRGAVRAAWNGSFYGVDAAGRAVHVAPVVVAGKVYARVGNHRWTFGVRWGADGPRFGLRHLPEYGTLGEFDEAVAGVQALVREGRPLRLPEPPHPGEPPQPRPVPSTPEEVGAIPDIDFLPTSRTALGWSADQTRLWVLIVRQAGAGLAGWTLADLQRFWLARGVGGAVNLDGGPETQAVLAGQNRQWWLVPAAKTGGPAWVETGPELPTDPGGGGLMTWAVLDTGEAR